MTTTQHHDRFLDAVAQHVAQHMRQYPAQVLVFPNKRSAIYFRGYFRRHLPDMVLMPKIMTIGAFYNLFATDNDFEADPVELLFILYKAYCNVMVQHGVEPVDFTRFSFWGRMILDDFNDIDASLANASDLYTNLKRFNEIQSFFLNDEQRRIIAEIWGDKAMLAFTPPVGRDIMWKPTDSDIEHPARNKFLKMWQILAPIYSEFNNLIQKQGITYHGKTIRIVSEAIKSMGKRAMPFDRAVFIGFNRLSLGQAKIMKTLQNWDKAQFFWDVLPNEPYTKKVGVTVHRLAKAFPMPDDFAIPEYTIPDITIYSVPSNSLQNKQASAVLQQLDKHHLLNVHRADNTVVVLPDAALLTGLLQSLPKAADVINVTMGIPYRNTPFASVLRNIISLNMRSGVFRGKLSFFHEDVTALISQPVMRTLAPVACMKIKEMLQRSRQFRVPASVLREMAGFNGLQCIFGELTDPDSPQEAEEYLLNVLDALQHCIEQTTPSPVHLQEAEILKAYRQAAVTVFEMVKKYGVMRIRRGTIFGLLERIFALQKFNIAGSPVRGLQIMEPLETRCLDFDNVILLSMNESVYPRRKQMRSMIPMSLRYAYGLPTSTDSDNEFAYYFFRLLSRSKRVACLYDSRTAGRGNGAMSRLLLQLKHLNIKATVTEKVLEMIPLNSVDRAIVVHKDERIQQKLQLYLNPVHGRNISASALKNYRKCPLKFYLENVEGLREDDNPLPYMDAITYGKVVHKVLEDRFSAVPKNANFTATIDSPAITFMRSKDSFMENHILSVIDELYYNNANNNSNAPLPGEARLLAKMIKDYIYRVMDKELKTITAPNSGPFTFIAAEEAYATIPAKDSTDIKCSQWQVSANHAINFKLVIDRHDIMANGDHRFVDYKTGVDSGNVPSIEALFGQSKDANDAIFQLCIYSLAYADILNFKGSIRPALYRFQDAFKKRNKERDFDDDAVTIGKTPVVFCNNQSATPEWQDPFRQQLAHMVDSIFDVNTPFVQTNDPHNCTFCPFAEICGRTVPEED